MTFSLNKSELNCFAKCHKSFFIIEFKFFIEKIIIFSHFCIFIIDISKLKYNIDKLVLTIIKFINCFLLFENCSNSKRK